MRFRKGAEPDVAGALGAVVDGLRSGLSLRQSILRSAGAEGSPPAPLAPVADELHAGAPLADVLREAAAATTSSDLRSALCVLAAHAEAGGDPTPAVSALADRLRRREAARREAKALTTQARLGARVMLLLTPAFWALIAAGDPRGTWRAMTGAGTRTAVTVGVILQLVGALWIGAIVRRAAGPAGREGFIRRVPVLRAVAALVAGRRPKRGSDDVAQTAETLAFVLDAGQSPSAGLAWVAPLAPGGFGERLRAANARVHAGVKLTDAVTGIVDGDPAAARFASAFEGSLSLGVPLAPRLREIADEVRERSVSELSEEVRRASIRVLVPLGLLILPAFVLSCLVPLLAGGLQGIAGA